MNGHIAHAVAFALGLLVVLLTWQSIIVTVILPRRSRNVLALVTWLTTYRVVTLAARLAPDRRRFDGLLALLGPVNIIVLLVTWMACFTIGFGLLFFGTSPVSVAGAIDLAGSSIFTLGFATPTSAASKALVYAAAASGMVVIALQIGYLPTIYGAYSAREALVTLLNMRAQESGVITGPLVLANHPLPASAGMLDSLFSTWETCAAAVIESHTNYPWLIVFRSPRSSESWVTSMLAILDAIALLDAVAPGAVSGEARHCEFACSAAMHELANMLLPRPVVAEANEPIAAAEVRAALEAVVAMVPAERTLEEACATFATSRFRYETDALLLGAFLSLPRIGWLRPVAR